MFRFIFLFLVFLILTKNSFNQFIFAEDNAANFSKDGFPFLQKNCLSCHSGKKPKAELSLDIYPDSLSLQKNRKVWDNVIRNINSGEMPPKEKLKPPIQESEKFVLLVKTIFNSFDRNAKPNPGKVTMRRLNRVEYKNTIRDLIGIDFDPTGDFPSDDIGYGFDNIGEVLTLSPILMERYLAASETILSRAITPEPPALVKRHVTTLYAQPSSGEVEKKAMEARFRRMETDAKENYMVGPLFTPYLFENDGEYIFRTKVYAKSGDGNPVRMAILTHGKNLSSTSSPEALSQLSGNVLKSALILKTFDIQADSPTKAQSIEVKIPAMANRENIYIAQFKPNPNKPANKLYVEHFALEGPLDSRPSTHKVLLTADNSKSKEIQSKEIMERFLKKAFRRTPLEQEVKRSLALIDNVVKKGEKWEFGIQLAMQAAICSPKFLFKIEPESKLIPDSLLQLDDFQIASRLSYFIWSSMPDDILLDLATKKTLLGNLDSQVKRMLSDPKASALVENFAMQWLQLKRLELVAPDAKLFPSFSPNLKSAMRTETVLFFHSIIKEDRSILDLIDADFTFLNETLAKHYGITDTNGNKVGQKVKLPGGQPIKGEGFVRVSLQDKNLGGLLTQASVLTVTSNPTRTSPVKRGRWVLEQILGAPPPPPPPDVPELPADEKTVAEGTLRQRMEQHRKNPSCANCHAKMDPIGFALENYNAIGAFRSKDGKFDIDVSGEFADGTKFNGAADLKSIIKLRKNDFSYALVEKMFTYSLGRGIEYYDRPTIEKVVKSLADNNYKFSVLVTAIVQADAFQKSQGNQQ